MAFQLNSRSISLPSRLNPGTLRLEETLNKLKALEDSSPSTINSIQSRLVNLASLYLSFTDLIDCRALSPRLVEESIDASAAFINACSTARDTVSSLNSHVSDLESAIRRRSSVDAPAASYTAFRKKSRKQTAECLRELRATEAKLGGFSPFLDADHRVVTIIRAMREVADVAVRVFRDLLVLISAPVSGARWSVVSRLAKREVVVVSEVGCADVAVASLGKKSVDLDGVRRDLRVVGSALPEMEAALDACFRSLVRNRVALLNVVSC